MVKHAMIIAITCIVGPDPHLHLSYLFIVMSNFEDMVLSTREVVNVPQAFGKNVAEPNVLFGGGGMNAHGARKDYPKS